MGFDRFRRHTDYRGTEDEPSVESGRVEVYGCEHCDETWTVDAGLSAPRELRSSVFDHVRHEHPGALAGQ